MITKQKFEKIEQYEELTASLADNYKTIIADLGRCK
jgi:hypothetical protein